MSAFGLMFHRFKRTVHSISFHDDDVDLSEHVANTMKQVSNFMSRKLPGVLSLFKSLRSMGGLSIPSFLGGESNGCTSNIAVSVGLMNASHIDCNDASVGMALFSETLIGSAGNWYLVFPNILSSPTTSCPNYHTVVCDRQITYRLESWRKGKQERRSKTVSLQRKLTTFTVSMP